MLLHELVTHQADQRPDKTAVVHGDEAVTYGALDLASNRIARLLRDLGCRPGDRVCLFLPKSIAAVEAMIGVLKAGAIYVPMDTAAPAARAERILRSAAPRVAIRHAEAAPLIDGLRESGALGAEILTGPADGPALATDAFSLADRDAFADIAPPLDGRPGDIAHLLFTSGSTGNPKGVMITHANVTAFLDWAVPYFGIGPDDRTSGHPPLHFDLSTFDIYGSLSAGAELHLVPPHLTWHPHKLAAMIREDALTQWFSVPAVLTLMIKARALLDDDFPALRRLLWCGDVLPTPVLRACMERLPHVRFTNLYGPTEATIASSYHTVCEAPPPDVPVPIGRACGAEELIVLDAAMNPLPTGEIGELYIGGAGLSPGYWRDAEKTAAAFCPDLRDPDSGARLYRTGDLARLDEDGEIRFLGRVDSQIKSRGYRIELGEIERALDVFGDFAECAVVGVPSEGFEGTAICCAFAPAPGASVNLAAVGVRLRSLLPAYMIPGRWMEFGELPKNPNGKIDRKQLRTAFTNPAPSEAAT